jgi:hypothetical protein
VIIIITIIITIIIIIMRLLFSVEAQKAELKYVET